MGAVLSIYDSGCPLPARAVESGEIQDRRKKHLVALEQMYEAGTEVISPQKETG
jgi:hypothetical protein